MTRTAISRRSDVVSRVEGDETLVLDLQSQVAHCLSEDVALVWNATAASVKGIVSATGLSEESVDTALAALEALGLVATSAGLSRRTLVARGALVGGIAVASVALPSAAMAVSGPTVSVTPTSGVMGTVLTVTGTGFKSNGTITSVTLGGVAITTFSSSSIAADGSFSFTFTVPSNAYAITANTLETLVVKDNATPTQNQAQASWTLNKPAVTLSDTTFTKHTGGGNGTATFTVSTTSPAFATSSTITVTSTGLVTNVTSSPPAGTSAAGVIPTSTTFTITYSNGAGSGTVTFTDAKGNSTLPVTLTFA